MDDKNAEGAGQPKHPQPSPNLPVRIPRELLESVPEDIAQALQLLALVAPDQGATLAKLVSQRVQTATSKEIQEKKIEQQTRRDELNHRQALFAYVIATIICLALISLGFYLAFCGAYTQAAAVVGAGSVAAIVIAAFKNHKPKGR